MSSRAGGGFLSERTIQLQGTTQIRIGGTDKTELYRGGQVVVVDGEYLGSSTWDRERQLYILDTVEEMDDSRDNFHISLFGRPKQGARVTKEVLHARFAHVGSATVALGSCRIHGSGKQPAPRTPD